MFELRQLTEANILKIFGLMYSLSHHHIRVNEVFVFFCEEAHLNQVPPLKGPRQTAVESAWKQDKSCD